jgi:hypothetical protein
MVDGRIEDECDHGASDAPLVIELLGWIEERPRTYADAQEAWRSHCPRHSPWEDAQIEGLIRLEGGAGSAARVVLTERGRARLEATRRR